MILKNFAPHALEKSDYLIKYILDWIEDLWSSTIYILTKNKQTLWKQIYEL